MEATASAKDPYLRWATFAPSPDDESHTPSHGLGAVVCSPLCAGEDEDCPHLFFHVPNSTGSMAGGGGCSSRCVIGRGVLELPYRRLL